MQYIDAISTMSCALNGTSMCVAAKRELWATPVEGDAFAVHSIMDEGGADCVFYIIYVTDYRGNRYPFEKLTRESQEALLDWVIDERFMDERDWTKEEDDYGFLSKRERAMSEAQRKYAACIYGYTLEPLMWQEGYKWSDYVADSDFSLRMGIEDKDGPIVSERVARMWYESYREAIERNGLEDFYLSNFGYLYRSDAE
jgi:hypothetical protein